MAYAEKRQGTLTGRWWGEVLTKTNGRFKRSFESKREALAYEAYVRATGAEPAQVSEGRAVAARGRTFREVAERCKEQGGPRGVWLNGRDQSILQRVDFAVARIGDYAIEDVTRALVRDKIASAPALTGLSQATINRYVSAVSAVLTWAVNEDLLPSKPTLQFKAEEPTRVERNTVSFELQDRAVAWLRADGRNVVATIVEALAETGMRLGEVYKLAPEQVENDHIRLRKDQTKTGKARTIYIAPALARELRAVIASQALPDPTHVLKQFKKACRECGERNSVTLHGLRHTRRTRLRKAGVPEEVIMKMLGHTSVEVSRGYDHVDLDDQRKAAEAVGELRGDPVHSAEIVPIKSAG